MPSKLYVNAETQAVGDVPIFVASDSADTWSNLHLFKTDAQGRFSAVSGVPPDIFSETGQLWGNPVYDWDVLKKDGYGWWIKRLERLFAMTDILRIDHFRGFDAYYEIPSGDATAENGKWVEARTQGTRGAPAFQTSSHHCGGPGIDDLR